MFDLKTTQLIFNEIKKYRKKPVEIFKNYSVNIQLKKYSFQFPAVLNLKTTQLIFNSKMKTL